MHKGAIPKNTQYFLKKTYKGMYKVKMDIFKCPKLKKILEIYFGKKREIYL